MKVILSSVGLAASATYKNAALDQPTFVSSLYAGSASNDGNDGDLTTCLAAGYSPLPTWWAVDLGAPSTVVKVIFTAHDFYSM